MDFSATQIFILELKSIEAISQNSKRVHLIKWKIDQVKKRLCADEHHLEKAMFKFVSLQVSTAL